MKVKVDVVSETLVQRQSKSGKPYALQRVGVWYPGEPAPFPDDAFIFEGGAIAPGHYEADANISIDNFRHVIRTDYKSMRLVQPLKKVA